MAVRGTVLRYNLQQALDSHQSIEPKEHEPTTRRKRTFPRHLLYALALLIALSAVGATAFYLLRPRLAIPENIAKDLAFTPFVVKGSDVLRVESTTYKYEPTAKAVSFIADGSAVGRLTISEQATPQEFIDIPNAYTKVTDGMNRYSVFQNQLGTVYLTRPTGQSSGQTAVMNASGVLLFIRSTKDLSDDKWRQIFSTLMLDK